MTDTVPDPRAFGLAGRRVLVTGASRGIGEAIAAAFVAAGARVTILAENAAVHTVAEALSAGATHAVEAIRCDVTNQDAVTAAAARVEALDVLVNNAGIEYATPLDDAGALAVAQRTLAVNVAGMFAITQALLPRLVEGGAIVNTASVWARMAPAGFSAYAASKHAVLGLTRAWSRELAGRRIRVNAVCPGWVATGAALNSLATIAAARGVPADAIKAEIEASQDIPGLMLPADVAPLYLFLASPLATNITGQGFNIDRGEVQS